MKVRISRSLLEQIVALAAADSHEVCGLLLGEGSWISAIRPAANVASDPGRHFELDPAVLLAAHRAARTGGTGVLGHYHSHPSGLAEPSATDAANAAPDGSLWLIVAVGGARLWRSGQGEGDHAQFTPVALDVM